MSRFPLWSHSFWLSHQNPICTPFLLNTCHMPWLSQPSWLDHSNYIWWKLQVMKMISRSLWQWIINTVIVCLDLIHCLAFI
jgi:hypothetical protein